MKELIKVSVLVLITIGVFCIWIHSSTMVSPKVESPVQEKQEPPAGNEEADVTPQKDQPIVHITRQDGTQLELALETYLEGVVGSEMPATFEKEALKAQCVAARTFATRRGFEVDDTTSTQVYHDDEQMRQIWGDNYDAYHENIVSALRETQGEILTYKGEVISSVFFSSSCGKTGNSEEYWNDANGYLRSVDSHWDKAEARGFATTTHVSAQEFANKLGFVNPVTSIGEPTHYDSGYVNEITIDTITFTGREIREKLGLRSSSFTIVKQDDGYDITTNGYGHGLGMSQYGAQGMAKEGYSYQEILKHYYTDVEIVQN